MFQALALIHVLDWVSSALVLNNMQSNLYLYFRYSISVWIPILVLPEVEYISFKIVMPRTRRNQSYLSKCEDKFDDLFAFSHPKIDPLGDYAVRLSTVGSYFSSGSGMYNLTSSLSIPETLRFFDQSSTVSGSNAAWRGIFAEFCFSLLCSWSADEKRRRYIFPQHSIENCLNYDGDIDDGFIEHVVSVSGVERPSSKKMRTWFFPLMGRVYIVVNPRKLRASQQLVVLVPSEDCVGNRVALDDKLPRLLQLLIEGGESRHHWTWDKIDIVQFRGPEYVNPTLCPVYSIFVNVVIMNCWTVIENHLKPSRGSPRSPFGCRGVMSSGELGDAVDRFVKHLKVIGEELLISAVPGKQSCIL